MPILPLVELRIEHAFCAGGICPEARVWPDEVTAARLAGLRLLIRPARGGLTLFGDFDASGLPLVPLAETTLRFKLGLPPEVAAATDLSGIGPATVFVEAPGDRHMTPVTREPRARETVAKRNGEVTVVLAGRPLAETATQFRVGSPVGVTVTGWDQAGGRLSLAGPEGTVEIEYPVAPPRIPGVFATLEVAIGPKLAAAALERKPKQLTIALQATAARWCYHLITDLPQPLAEWRIAQPASDAPPVRFAVADAAELAEGDLADSYGGELASRSAPLRVLRFVSDAPVPCSEIAAQRIALFAGGRQLFAALPNPSPAALRRIGSQPVFGEVLRFVTA